MLRVLFVLIALVHVPALVPRAAAADNRTVCFDVQANPESGVAACSRLIGSGEFRGKQLASMYSQRGYFLQKTQDYDRAIADFSEAIRLVPEFAGYYLSRAQLRREKGDFGRALADHDKVIALAPKFPIGYVLRGNTLREKGDLDAALADFDHAIALEPKAAEFYAARGIVWRAKGDFDRALGDLDRAIRIEPRSVVNLTARGLTYESMGELARARADFAAASALPAKGVGGKGGMRIQFDFTREQNVARTRLGLLGAAPAPLQRSPGTHPPPQPAPPVRETAKPQDKRARIALVIGNGAYRGAGALPNPPNDARELANTLRGMRYQVTEAIDLDRAGMESAIREFLLKAPQASLALLFYAGHAVQIDGKNYLVPVDAKVTANRNIVTEMTALDTILAGLDDNIRTNIVILDACRDNPFVRQEVADNFATRSIKIGPGLAAPGDLGKGATLGAGTLIAFATAPGATALDGADGHSPFSRALLRHVSTPGLEVQQMLTRVRAEVVAATRSKQVPWANSSLLGEVFLVGDGR